MRDDYAARPSATILAKAGVTAPGTRVGVQFDRDTERVCGNLVSWDSNTIVVAPQEGSSYEGAGNLAIEAERIDYVIDWTLAR